MKHGLILVGIVLALLAGVFTYYGWVILKSGRAGAVASWSLDSRLWAVPDFELLNCDGESVSRQDLMGEVWVAAFIFTRCPGPCPVITQRMVEIQNSLDANMADVRLVSFTIDPTYDRPGVLLEYAKRWKADTHRWYFLTAESEELVQELTQAFRVAAYREPADNANGVPNITHGTNLLLVDQTGWVRGIYSTEEAAVSSQVVDGIKWLLADRG